MPILRRKKSAVFKADFMERNPLCPPRPPYIRYEKEKEKSITIDVNTVIYVPSDGSKQTLGNFLKQMYGS